MKILMKLLFVGLFLITCVQGASNTKEKPAIWVNSDGKGNISIFWLPGERWPLGGWKLERLENGKTTVLADKILPGTDPKAMEQLSEEEVRQIRSFTDKLQKGQFSKDESEMAVLVFGLKGAIQIEYGKALGLRFTDSESTKGKRSYRLSELGVKGMGESVVSAMIDPTEATALPRKVDDVSAVQQYEGVELSWKIPPVDGTNPLIGYQIERKDPDGKIERLTPVPMIINDELKTGAVPLYIDKKAPAGETVTYLVSSVNLFGIKSLPSEKTVVIRDLNGLMPPVNLSGEEKEGEVVLEWTPNPDSTSAGYLIERAFLQKGPYVTITAEGLFSSATKYTDKNLIGGTAYYYRIRSIASNGEIGEPSYPIMAQPKSEEPPARVKGLKADIGNTIVTLRWDKSEKPVAGYNVYRRAKGADKWSQMTTYLVPDTRFDDDVGSMTFGSYEYRVSAVGYDSLEGKPSDPLEVTLRDTISPNPPYLTDIDGSNGKVILRFKAAPPIEDTDHFYLVRSVTPSDPGLVIGEAIPATQESVTDTFVRYGQRYWYRLVAVDKAGNRSELGQAKTVVVQNPPIPVPDKPKLKYVAQPVPHIVIDLNEIPERLSVLIQRRYQNAQWQGIVGEVNERTVVDTIVPLPDTMVEYRIMYKAENGATGEASKVAEIKIPQ